MPADMDTGGVGTTTPVGRVPTRGLDELAVLLGQVQNQMATGGPMTQQELWESLKGIANDILALTAHVAAPPGESQAQAYVHDGPGPGHLGWSDIMYGLKAEHGNLEMPDFLYVYWGEPEKFHFFKDIFVASFSEMHPIYGVQYLDKAMDYGSMADPPATSLEKELSNSLFQNLVRCSRRCALTLVWSAGGELHQGDKAWRALCNYYEPLNEDRTVALMLEMLNFDFDGESWLNDELQILAKFEQIMLRYNVSSKVPVPFQLVASLVVKGIDDVGLQEHLVRRSMQLKTWVAFKEEVLIHLRHMSKLRGTRPPAFGSLARSPFSFDDRKGEPERGWSAGGETVKGWVRDRCDKGKGYSKGKEDDADLVCHSCGLGGHRMVDCPALTQQRAAFEEGLASVRSHDSSCLCDDCIQQREVHAGVSESWREFYESGSDTSTPPTPHEDRGFSIHSLEQVLGDANKSISALSQQLENCNTLRLGVDSGAAETVVPSRLGAGRPVTPPRQGAHYVTAAGDSLPDEGSITLTGLIGGEHRALRAHISPVHKALVSVSAMVAAGHKVVFEKNTKTGRDCSRSIHTETGEITYFTLRNGVYEMDMVLDVEGDNVDTAETARTQPFQWRADSTQ